MEKPNRGFVMCGQCGQKFYEPSEDTWNQHHESTLDHAGVKISQCDANRISQDGP